METKFQKLEVLKVSNFFQIGLFYFFFLLVILGVNISFVLKLGLTVKRQIAKANRTTDQYYELKSRVFRRNISILLYRRLNKLHESRLDFVLKNMSTQKLKLKTTILMFLIILAFALDSFFKSLSVILLTFFENNTKSFKYLFIIVFSIVFTLQISYTILFIRFNRVYIKRLKFLYKTIII